MKISLLLGAFIYLFIKIKITGIYFIPLPLPPLLNVLAFLPGLLICELGLSWNIRGQFSLFFVKKICLLCSQDGDWRKKEATWQKREAALYLEVENLKEVYFLLYGD